MRVDEKTQLFLLIDKVDDLRGIFETENRCREVGYKMLGTGIGEFKIMLAEPISPNPYLKNDS